MTQIRDSNNITTLNIMALVETFDKELNRISSYLAIILTR